MAATQLCALIYELCLDPSSHPPGCVYRGYNKIYHLDGGKQCVVTVKEDDTSEETTQITLVCDVEDPNLELMVKNTVNTMCRVVFLPPLNPTSRHHWLRSNTIMLDFTG
jgi:hypothetical protein